MSVFSTGNNLFLKNKLPLTGNAAIVEEQIRNLYVCLPSKCHITVPYGESVASDKRCKKYLKRVKTVSSDSYNSIVSRGGSKIKSDCSSTTY